MKVVIIECNDIDNKDKCKVFENKKEAKEYINKKISKDDNYINNIMCFINEKRVMNIERIK